MIHIVMLQLSSTTRSPAKESGYASDALVSRIKFCYRKRWSPDLEKSKSRAPLAYFLRLRNRRQQRERPRG